jgi:outer membrane protein OmpA-like peptidoglycan-associated protein
MHKILSVIFIVTGIVSAYKVEAQQAELEELKLWQIKGYAKSAVKQKDIYSAIYFYEYLVEKYPGKTSYYWTLASQYQLSRNYSKAYQMYDRLITIDKRKAAKAKYNKAINAKSLEKYTEAYQMFKELRPGKRQGWMPRNFKGVLKMQMAGCKLALSLRDSVIRKDILHLPNSINTPHIEFNPFYVSDSTFIFSSADIDTLLFYNNEEAMPKRRFFISSINDSGYSSKEKPGEPFFNNPKFDTGDGVFSFDGNRIYFTQCAKNWQQKMVCHLYMSEKESDKWSEPVKLSNEINLKNHTSTQPAVGTCYDPNLEVIYFVSDRPEGYGGTDIWYTIFDIPTHTFQKPVNVGFMINTEGDETTPYFDVYEHQLYFSSNGWVGFGGLDIYLSKGDLVNWEEPENIGYPLNSECDDLYFTKNELGNKGFFTSNRPGGYSLLHNTCCDDIYFWEQSEIEKVWVRGKMLGSNYDVNALFTKKGKVEIGRDSVVFLDSAKVNLYLKNDTSEMVFMVSKETDKDGNFSFLVPKGFEYEIFIDDSRVLDKKLAFNTTEIKTRQLEIDLKPIEVKTISKNPIILSNIYYEFNKANLTDASKLTIDSTLLKLMKKYEDIFVVVSSHTDKVGNVRYNQRLSQQRANNVVNYMVEQGIEKYRLRALGFGKSKPIAPNTLPNGSDNPEGRALNRRTEFRVVDSREIRK